jgi:hypothetical protein
LKIKYLKIVRSQKKFFIGPQTGTFIGHRIARASPVHCSRLARASLAHRPRITRASTAHRPRIAAPAYRPRNLSIILVLITRPRMVREI